MKVIHREGESGGGNEISVASYVVYTSSLGDNVKMGMLKLATGEQHNLDDKLIYIFCSMSGLSFDAGYPVFELSWKYHVNKNNLGSKFVGG